MACARETAPHRSLPLRVQPASADATTAANPSLPPREKSYGRQASQQRPPALPRQLECFRCDPRPPSDRVMHNHARRPGELQHQGCIARRRSQFRRRLCCSGDSGNNAMAELERGLAVGSSSYAWRPLRLSCHAPAIPATYKMLTSRMVVLACAEEDLPSFAPSRPRR